MDASLLAQLAGPVIHTLVPGYLLPGTQMANAVPYRHCPKGSYGLRHVSDHFGRSQKSQLVQQ
jgi:hypothetical protein